MKRIMVELVVDTKEPDDDIPWSYAPSILLEVLNRILRNNKVVQQWDYNFYVRELHMIEKTVSMNEAENDDNRFMLQKDYLNG